MATSTPQNVSSGLLSAPQENAAVNFLTPNAMGLLSTMATQPQAMATAPKFAGAKPNMKEFMDATGVDAATASDILYGVVGSNRDTRNWNAIFASQDPVTAARQATAAMYGGVKSGIYIDPITGERSSQLIGTSKYYPLTTPGSRDINFGAGLNASAGQNLINELSSNPIIDAMRAAAGVQIPMPIQSQPLIAPMAQPQVAQTIAPSLPRATQPVNQPVVQQASINRVPPQIAPQVAQVPQINAQQQQALNQRAQQRQALQAAIETAAASAPRQTSASRYAPGLPNVGMAAEDFYRYLTQNLIQPRVMNKDTIAKKG